MNALHYVMSHLKAAQVARDERSVTALEYAMIAALIGVVIIGAVTTLGTSIQLVFDNISGKMATTAASAK
jgi:pilus assembly protein Flp/PilA